MAQTQYQNMDNGCEDILLQGKGLHHSQKLRNAVAIYKTSKLIFFNKYLKKVPEKRQRLGKRYLTQKVPAPNLFSLTNHLHILCFCYHLEQ